ncbi:helix-turn-helix domain-containing protein [Actinoplanes sp. KI2]|uniref:helix-turn-helix transcriptional regulator n=1 Tax=Actinoplanes sp. KI2 TaxID=2983315 RepID=UPI0021D5D10C|nr:helix-turn-helix domain-containing protein [Actinoplanes sp. KI2]MCU7730320.1 helix-turn-helix domain-containing protein [Actinoplanes sp. KI2]
MTTPQPDRQASRRRGQVLRLLRIADRPMAIAEIAQRLGIHVNTARFHLETLVSNGQVERTTADSGSPGRPPQLFQAVRRMDPMGTRHFRVLAEVLAGAIDTDADPGDRILRAGQQWGLRQASTAAGPGKASGPAEPVDRLMRLLDELGFAPERDDSDGRRVGLRQCPFLELAVSRSDVVCPAHLGLMQGAMQAWESPITVERLHPFVEPDLCMAHLGPAGES